MNLIYMRSRAPRAKKFIRGKLRSRDAGSIREMREGDCCLAPAPVKRGDFMLTYAADISPEALLFIYRSAGLTQVRN